MSRKFKDQPARMKALLFASAALIVSVFSFNKWVLLLALLVFIVTTFVNLAIDAKALGFIEMYNTAKLRTQLFLLSVTVVGMLGIICALLSIILS